MALLCAKEEKNSIDGKRTTLDRRLRKSLSSCNRSVTDKYWCILFVFIFIIWITSMRHASYHLRPDSNINTDTAVIINRTKGLAPFYLWGKSWIFDAVTCNLAFLNEHYKNSGSIVIWANVLFCIFLFKWSLSSMGNNNMFRSQLGIACVLFIFLRYFQNDFMFAPNAHPTLKATGYKNVELWLIPDIIFILVSYIKKVHTDAFLKNYYDELRFFHQFQWLLIPFIVIPLMVYILLIICTMNAVYELGCYYPLSYVIVGGSCYIGLTIFYFWLIVVSCIIDMEMNVIDEPKYLSTGMFRALAIAGRYHFGTACYHATLIFPRLETLIVMNEPGFRKEEKLSKFFDRFYAAQFKLHNLTLMSTAVSGMSHSESLKELLHHFASDLKPSLEYFQGFSRITKSASALLLSTNSLILIFLWAYGLDDPSLSLSTWIFYIRLMITFNIAIKVFDIISDTTFLYVKWVPFTYMDLFTYWSEFGQSAEPID